MELRKARSIAALITFLFSSLLLSPTSHAVITTVGGTVSKVSNGDTLQVITQKAQSFKSDYTDMILPEPEKEAGKPKNQQTWPALW